MDNGYPSFDNIYIYRSIINSFETTKELNNQNDEKSDEDFKCKSIIDMLNSLEKYFAFFLLRLREEHILPASRYRKPTFDYTKQF